MADEIIAVFQQIVCPLLSESHLQSAAAIHAVYRGDYRFEQPSFRDAFPKQAVQTDTQSCSDVCWPPSAQIGGCRSSLNSRNF
ncbi:MAG: hypothetical protein DMF72_21230, partial [Acidobacteria bacterium]